MSNVYIRSQNREKLYQLGGNYATLEYVEYMKKRSRRAPHNKNRKRVYGRDCRVRE